MPPAGIQASNLLADLMSYPADPVTLSRSFGIRRLPLRLRSSAPNLLPARRPPEIVRRPTNNAARARATVAQDSAHLNERNT